jgi:hypothetical protein
MKREFLTVIKVRTSRRQVTGFGDMTVSTVSRYQDTIGIRGKPIVQ